MSAVRSLPLVAACMSFVFASVAIATCGDGVVDGVEACDLGSENGSATTCCTSRTSVIR